MDKHNENQVNENQAIENQPNDLVNEYLKSLNKDQLKIIEIAKKVLESSYDITKSTGYLKYIKKRNSY
jgi:hypothetical protein